MTPFDEPDERDEPDWDVLVVGRSYAGLSTALMLGRARRSVLVVGSGGPRNDAVVHTHGLVTRDGASPRELVEAAEKELQRYPTVELVDDRVTGIVALERGFRATIGPRPTTAGAVVLATGANDNPPAIPGLDRHWGRGVFTCPYCDGFEHADRRLAVTGTPAAIAHVGKLLTVWSNQVTAFSGDLDAPVRADLEAHGVVVDDRPLARVEGDGTGITSVTVTDGTSIPVDALFLAQFPIPNSGLARQLSCATDENGFVTVDAAQRTTVAGVWAVGDVASTRANMALAIAAGVTAAVDINTTLLDAAWAMAS